MKFEEIQKIDFLTNREVINDVKRGKAEIKGDKLVYNFKQLNPETPWMFHTEKESERNCTLWHKIYFDKFGLLPRGCMNCWKIVARPKNLDQLFELDKLQSKMDIPCKCGVDIRPTETYKGIHLGFWYCPLGDMDKARELFVEVRRKVRGALSLDTPVILKRGCTEMENHFGVSNEWNYPQSMRNMEDLLETTIVVEEEKPPQTSYIRIHVINFWIQYSHRMGDKTARKYVKDFPTSMGSIPTATYHEKLPPISIQYVPSTEEIRKEKEKIEAGV